MSKLCLDETEITLQFCNGFSDERSFQRLSVKNIRTFTRCRYILFVVFVTNKRKC